MENTTHSNFKKSDSKKYLVFFSPSIKISHINTYDLNLTDKKFLANLHIEQRNTDFLVTVKNKNNSLICIKERNFSLFLKNLAESIQIKKLPDDTKSKNLEKRNKHKNKKNIEALSDLFEKSKKISTFCQLLLKSKFFQDYKSIHLFIHKKGSAFSRHLHVQAEDLKETSESIIDFSTLFQAVKKSKNRSFGQATLKASNFKISGTCIAQEYSLLNHNLVFVFSGDNFLPQTKSAVDDFNTINQYLKVYFELLLNTEFNDHQTMLIKNTIMTLLNLSGSAETTFGKIEKLDEDNYVNFDLIIKKLKENFFDHADINLVERITLLGELLNTLQHELSNPLFGLQLSTEILLQENLDSEQKMFVENINKSIIRSQNILKNFSGLYQSNIQTEQNNLFDLIHEVMTLTKSESRNIKKEVVLKDIHKDDCFIKTNQTWLAQIIFNLIINSSQALRTMGLDSPAIEIGIEKDSKNYFISVTDNGAGITKDLQKLIFDPFYTTKKEGNGLGLAISKKLALKLGGDLVYKEQEVGACFVLRLPQ